MKLLRRNTTIFQYLPPTGEESDLNELGEHTGEYHPVYGEPVRYRGNISTPSGKVNQTFYGLDKRYTHTLVMDNPRADIRENGKILWRDSTYEVVAVRDSLNILSVALRRETDNNGEPYEEAADDEPDPEDD